MPKTSELYGARLWRGIVLVRALGDTASAPLSDVSMFHPVDATGAATAHRFEVVDVVGGAAGLEVGDSMLAIPWSYDAGCNALWFDVEWVPAGELAVFYLYPAHSRRQDGELLIDVLGEHYPYPQAEYVKYSNYPNREGNLSEWLSADAFFELLSTLPSLGAGGADREWRQAVAAVAERWPTLWRDSFPGRSIMRDAIRGSGL